MCYTIQYYSAFQCGHQVSCYQSTKRFEDVVSNIRQYPEHTQRVACPGRGLSQKVGLKTAAETRAMTQCLTEGQNTPRDVVSTGKSADWRSRTDSH